MTDSAFAPEFDERLALGKYTRWAARLPIETLEALLWMVGEYGLRASFVDTRPVHPEVAARSDEALRTIAEIVQGKRIDLDAVRRRIRRAVSLPRGLVVVTGGPADRRGLAQGIRAGAHRLTSDEEIGGGGTDAGPTPYDLLLASLCASMSISIENHADRQRWSLEGVTVQGQQTRVHAIDCMDSESDADRLDRIDCEITLAGSLSDEQRAQLLAVAERCPLQKALASGILITTTLR